jgi:K+ transporter
MKIPFKVNPREKRILLIGGLIVIIIFIYQLSIWYNGMRTTLHDYTEAKEITLEKQLRKISEKENIQREHQALSLEIKELDKMLLAGDKPPVVAAKIQSILKEMASSLKIEITLEKALDPVDKELYLGIPVEIGFTAPTEKLMKMLYKIRTSKFIFTISEVKVLVKNVRKPVDAYTTIVVNGFIRKPVQQKKEEEMV